MNRQLAAGLLLCAGQLASGLEAQNIDPKLMREVMAVRQAVAQSNAALRQYSWTEHTQVLVGGDVKSSSQVVCRYDAAGDLTKVPIGEAKEQKPASAISKRSINRKKADMQDYIERALSAIRSYVPPKAEEMPTLLQNRNVSLGQAVGGTSEIRFKGYYRPEDSLVFTYDTESKRLLRVNVDSNLGSPKDPVTLEAVFEQLPDGLNHLSSTTLKANKKKVEVKTRNFDYRKVVN